MPHRALQALRVASSPYGGDMTGVSDVVNMDTEKMSLPEMGSRGVKVEQVLQEKCSEIRRI